MGDISIRGRSPLLKGGRASLRFGGGRTDLLEELGRVEGERSNPNRRAEISRVHSELNKGYKDGGRIGFREGTPKVVEKGAKKKVTVDPSKHRLHKYKKTILEGAWKPKAERRAEGGRIGFREGTDKKWMQKVSASIKKRKTKGKCTPITKKGCTGRALALAKTFKKIAAKNKKA